MHDERRDGEHTSNEQAFFNLLPHVAGMGVTRCFISVMSDYAKLRRRPARFLEIGNEQRVEVASAMLAAIRSEGVELYNCCNSEIPALVPGVSVAHCVDEAILRETDRFGMYKKLVNPSPPTWSASKNSILET